MCGISGWYLSEECGWGLEELEVFAHSMDHRGPDDFGTFLGNENRLAMALNRLAIIDLSERAHQPMIDPQSGAALVFNGEIFNHLELRKDLETEGHSFGSQSDTEVLLKAFLQWGDSALNRLRGMFGLALWSAKDRVLTFARDPLGIKPVYYWLMPGNQGIAFASELKAFLRLPGFLPEVDRRSLQEFLEFGYSFDEHRTIFRNVYKLPPGHTLEVKDGIALSPRAFFRADVDPSHQLSSREACEELLYETFEEIVPQHLLADVPVGVLLSGGLDSSLITAFASRHAQISTFNLAFEGSDLDESTHARLVSEHLGTDHHEITVTPQDLRNEIELAAPFFDDLFGDWGLLMTRVLYRRCREKGIKVVIVGEGADELFGGYPIFQVAAGACGVSVDWTLFQLYRRYAGRRYGRLFGAFRRQMKQYLRSTGGNLFTAVRLFEARNQLPNNYVMKVDKASMSVNVEARAPYLDQRVADVAYKIPSRFLLANGSNKAILRSMARRYDLLPPEIIEREKFGYPVDTSWIETHEEVRSFAREVVLEQGSWTDELGLRGAMLAFFDRGQQGYPFPRALSIFRGQAWRLLLLNLWSRSYLRGSAHA